MDPVRGRRKTARKELTHLPREDRRKTLSEKLKKNQPKRVDFPPQMAEFLLTEHTRLELADETARKNFHLPAVGIEDGCTFEHMVTAVLEFLLDDVFLGLRIGISRARHR
jgi:hypothetical protein